MQASQPGKGYDLPHDGRLDGSVFRGILGQGQMAPILVAEEGGPGLRSWPRGLGADAGKISRDGSLRHFEVELPEFGVNARGTPSRIRASHLADETSDFGANARPAISGFPSPEEPKGPMVPLDDGLGLNDDQASTPAAPSVEDESPKDPVPPGEMRPSRCRAMVDAELVAECYDLGRQGGSRPEEYDEGAGQEAYQGEHPGRIQGEGRPAEACPPNRRKPMLVSEMLAAWVRPMGF